MTDSTPIIRLAELRLEDARALVERDAAQTLPDPQQQPAAHVQGIVDGLCKLSMRDPLTGLFNRRHMLGLLGKEIEAVARTGGSALLLILDVDHFKKVNDTHGHHVGDVVLQAVAACLETCVRPMDTVARYGGEEFAVILPDCGAAFGLVVAERIRQAIAALSIVAAPQLEVKVTVSIGGAYAPEWVRSTPALWIERADAQLYRAKESGRNRVFIEVPHESTVSAEEKGMLFGHLLAGDPAWATDASGIPGN